MVGRLVRPHVRILADAGMAGGVSPAIAPRRMICTPVRIPQSPIARSRRSFLPQLNRSPAACRFGSWLCPPSARVAGTKLGRGFTFSPCLKIPIRQAGGDNRTLRSQIRLTSTLVGLNRQKSARSSHLTTRPRAGNLKITAGTEIRLVGYVSHLNCSKANSGKSIQYWET